MHCFVKVMFTICFASLIVAWSPKDSFSLPDLVVLKDHITIVKNSTEQATRVFITVKNIGDRLAGPFTLTYWGIIV